MEDSDLSHVSRRDFFKNPLKRLKGDNRNSVVNSESVSQLPNITLDRRQTLILLAKLGSIVAAPSTSVKLAENDYVNRLLPSSTIPSLVGGMEDKNSALEANIDLENNKISDFAKTAIETSLMEAGSIITGKIFDKYGIEHGNKSLSEAQIASIYNNFDVKTIIPVEILSPLLEENLFRKLPSQMLTKNEGIRWDVGIPTNVLFALIHNIRQEGLVRFKLEKSIPMEQFIGGVFYWYLMRTRGYNHAVFAHSLGNSGYVAVGSLLHQAFPNPDKSDEAPTHADL